MKQELVELLKEMDSQAEVISQFYQNNQFASKLEEIKKITNQENFWQHENRISITQEEQKLDEICSTYQTLISELADLKQMSELFAENSPEAQELDQMGFDLAKKFKQFKIALLLNEENDSKNCFITINPGAGGTESQDWASMLLRMYLRYCEDNRFDVKILDYQAGEEAGIKSATLFVKGKNAFGILKSEHGIHRLVRISPFDSAKRRHTSFAGVTLTPEVEETKVQIKAEDLRIDTYRSSGCGGQSVNTTDSAVRITHIPTGIVVQCQNERSQNQNKVQAMKMLAAKIYELEEEKRRAAEKSIEKKKIEWGSQIRSYVLHPYKMVKDHRTDFESGQPDKVLDGDLNPLIEQFLILRPDK